MVSLVHNSCQHVGPSRFWLEFATINQPDATGYFLMTDEFWEGELLIGFAFALFHGRSGDNQLHRHYATQCAYGDTAAVEVEWENGTIDRARWHHIPSESLHRIRATSSTVRMLYYEPTMLNSLSVEDLFEKITIADWKEADWSTYFKMPDAVDPRVRQALEQLRADVGISISATSMARSVGLSRNRLMELFSAEIGVPVRRYILWHRIKLAATEIARGANLTTAAHAAGFADSAHFARTMKAMFGVTATKGLNKLQIRLQ